LNIVIEASAQYGEPFVVLGIQQTETPSPLQKERRLKRRVRRRSGLGTRHTVQNNHYPHPWQFLF
jgi:hypothetical protein